MNPWNETDIATIPPLLSRDTDADTNNETVSLSSSSYGDDIESHSDEAFLKLKKKILRLQSDIQSRGEAETEGDSYCQYETQRQCNADVYAAADDDRKTHSSSSGSSSMIDERSADVIDRSRNAMSFYGSTGIDIDNHHDHLNAVKTSEIIHTSFLYIRQLMRENQEPASCLKQERQAPQAEVYHHTHSAHAHANAHAKYHIDREESNHSHCHTKLSSITQLQASSPTPSSTSTSTSSSSLHSSSRTKHQLSDARRYNTLKSLIKELDTIVHDTGDAYMAMIKKRCSTSNVLHEATQSIKELKHEKQMLTKAIQQLQYNDSDSDNDNDMNINVNTNMNMNRNQYPYPYHSNESPFTPGSRARSPSCSSSSSRSSSSLSLSLTLLQPSMSAFGIVLLKTTMHGNLSDLTDNVLEFLGFNREEIIGRKGTDRPAQYIPQSPAQRVASFEYYAQNGLIPPLTPQEYAFNSQGGGYYTRISTLMSMLMVEPARAMRHTVHSIRRGGSLIESVFSSTLVRTSDGKPDYLLSMVPLSTVRVIYTPSSTSTSSKAKRARVT